MLRGDGNDQRLQGASEFRGDGNDQRLLLFGMERCKLSCGPSLMCRIGPRIASHSDVANPRRGTAASPLLHRHGTAASFRHCQSFRTCGHCRSCSIFTDGNCAGPFVLLTCAEIVTDRRPAFLLCFRRTITTAAKSHETPEPYGAVLRASKCSPPSFQASKVAGCSPPWLECPGGLQVAFFSRLRPFRLPYAWFWVLE